ncbi:NAD-dependent epimerase/dehydratase family protein [Devosia sp.]|uniref:NAD-dependent epimerase/dehydratase family protein n=1 Tax=Devosia sp. TaxID=1871048 RepID=UPI003BAA24DF
MADQVLVTGIGGFIGLHVALGLLQAGHQVRGTLRDPARGKDIRDALAAAGGDISRLRLIVADLGDTRAWREAVEGCRYVQHVASPFPMRQPSGREALVDAARDGTINVVEAALGAGVERIVVTSSIVTMMYRAGRPGRIRVGETDWTDPEWRGLSPYIVSKTRAELALWERLKSWGASERVVTIHPGLVLGPLLSDSFGTSVGLIALLLGGKYPALTPVSYAVADVRDVAELHIRAMTQPGLGARRLIAAADTLSLFEIADILREALGPEAQKIPRRVLPGLLVRAIALVDPAVRAVTPDLGTVPLAETGYVTAATGQVFRPARDAVVAAGQSLVARRLI